MLNMSQTPSTAYRKVAPPVPVIAKPLAAELEAGRIALAAQPDHRIFLCMGGAALCSFDANGIAVKGALVPGTALLVPAATAAVLILSQPVEGVWLQLAPAAVGVGSRWEALGQRLAGQVDLSLVPMADPRLRGANAGQPPLCTSGWPLAALDALSQSMRTPHPLYHPDEGKPWVYRLITHIELHLDESLTVADLAEVAHIAIRRFPRRFRKTFGCTPYRFVLNRRLKRVQHLLLFSRASLADIAYSCGYSSQSHMTQHFSSSLGTPPGRYRSATA